MVDDEANIGLVDAHTEDGLMCGVNARPFGLAENVHEQPLAIGLVLNGLEFVAKVLR